MAELNLDLGGWENLEGIEVRFGLWTVDAQKRIMEDFGEDISAGIVDRTLQGTDKNGDEFEPYSTAKFTMIDNDEYFEKGLEAGGIVGEDKFGQYLDFPDGYAQFKQGLGEPLPNLSVLGRLMGKQHFGGGNVYDRPFGTLEATKDSVTVGFTDSEQAAIADKHIEGDGVPVRDFWGALETADEAEKMSDRFVETYDSFLSEAQEYLGLY